MQLTEDEKKVLETLRKIKSNGFGFDEYNRIGYGELLIIIQNGEIKDMIPKPRIRLN